MKSNVIDLQTKLPIAQPINAIKDDVIKFDNWYNFNVLAVSKPLLCKLIAKLNNIDEIDRFFFIRENECFMFVVHSLCDLDYLASKLKQLEKIVFRQIVLSHHKESKDKFENDDVFKSFANIMCETTRLLHKKLSSKQNEHSIYRFLERTQHCMFNVLTAYGTMKSENYFLLQRIAERISENFDEDFNDFHDNKSVIYKRYY